LTRSAACRLAIPIGDDSYDRLKHILANAHDVAFAHGSATPRLVAPISSESMPPIDREFTDAMLNICREAKKLGYRPGRFQQMIGEQGGLRTAQSLPSSAKVSEGFTTLWEMKRLDLSMEALVLKERWASLFTPEELAEARRRMREMGFEDDGTTRTTT
jgi:hypothetical protein